MSLPRAARRHVVVGDAEGQAGFGDRNAPLRQLAEGVERALVHVVAVDPEQRLAVLAADDLVGGPELVDQGLGLAHKSRAECICWANINEMRAEVCRFRTLGRNGCLVNFLPSIAAGFCSPRRRASPDLLHAPAVLRAQGAPVKVGVLHPVSGALSYSGPAGADRRATGDRGDQRRRRHQGAGRRQDRGGARRRAIDAGRRQRRGREDERRRRRGRGRRLRQRHLPCRQPDRRALRPALYRRRRRGRQHRQPRAEEHLPLRARASASSPRPRSTIS